MSINPQDSLTQHPDVIEFLDAVTPMLPAYTHGVVSYVALVHEGQTVILSARLSLGAAPPITLQPRLTTSNLRAGQAHVENLHADAVLVCIRALAQGHELPPIDDQLLMLLPDTAQSYSAYHETYRSAEHANTLTNHRLVLSGKSRFELESSRRKMLERELQGAGVDSLEELMHLYDLDASESCSFDIVANSVAGFDADCRLAERRLTLSISAAAALNPVLLKLIVRSADLSASQIPIVLLASQIQWRVQGDHLYVHHELDLPTYQLVDCRLLYDDRLQAQLTLADPLALPNERRMLLNTIDPGLTRVEGVLLNPGKQGQDFEAAFAWLLQLLGFAPIHIGAVSGLSDEVDILAQASDSDVLAVECTVGLPNDEKLTKLITRTARLQRQYQPPVPGRAPVRIVSMLVTPFRLEELAGIRAKAEQHSVVLLCRDEIEHAVQQSRYQPRPHLMLQRWRDLALNRLLTGDGPG